MSFFERLSLEGRVRETILVAVGPLRFPFFASDFSGVNETPFLGPFGGSGMVLVISYVLNVKIVTMSRDVTTDSQQ